MTNKKQNFEIVCKIISMQKNDQIKSIIDAKNKFYKVLKFLSIDKSNAENVFVKQDSLDSLYSNIFFEFSEEKNDAIKNIMRWKNFFLKALILKIDLITLNQCKNFSHCIQAKWQVSLMVS